MSQSLDISFDVCSGQPALRAFSRTRRPWSSVRVGASFGKRNTQTFTHIVRIARQAPYLLVHPDRYCQAEDECCRKRKAPILKICGMAASINAAILIVGLMTVSTPAIFPDTRTGAATYSAAVPSGSFGSRRMRAPYSPLSVSCNITPLRIVLADRFATVRIEQHDALSVGNIDTEIDCVLPHLVDLGGDVAPAHILEHSVEFVGIEFLAFRGLPHNRRQNVGGVDEGFLGALEVGRMQPPPIWASG